jgi:hypothetical protein
MCYKDYHIKKEFFSTKLALCQIIKSIFLISFFLLSLLLYSVPSYSDQAEFSKAHSAQNQGKIDFRKIAKKFPNFRTIVKLKFDRPLSVAELLTLTDSGNQVIGDNILSILGKSEAILVTKASRLSWLNDQSFIKAVIPLERFNLSGLYRIHFKLVGQEFDGPISFSVASPRNGFGKKLLDIESYVWPRLPYKISTDNAGNRWLKIKIKDASNGQRIKFDFFFVYRVDISALLRHSLSMIEFNYDSEKCVKLKGQKESFFMKIKTLIKKAAKQNRYRVAVLNLLNSEQYQIDSAIIPVGHISLEHGN